ncbi:MAG: hypothetical protein ABIK28_02555 [Planctomycetota bacterium]
MNYKIKEADSKDYEKLLSTGTFAHNRIGYEGRLSSEARCFSRLYRSEDHLKIFKRLFNETNSMASKLYALVAFYALDREIYGLYSDAVDRSLKVYTMYGCCLGEYEVGWLIDAIETHDVFSHVYVTAEEETYAPVEEEQPNEGIPNNINEKKIDVEDLHPSLNHF